MAGWSLERLASAFRHRRPTSSPHPPPHIFPASPLSYTPPIRYRRTAATLWHRLFETVRSLRTPRV